MTKDRDPELSRLCWGSRRGMLELDFFLMPFAEQVLPGLSARQRRDYRRLLDCEDQDLHAWLVEGEMLEDPELAGLVRRIREHAGPVSWSEF